MVYHVNVKNTYPTLIIFHTLCKENETQSQKCCFNEKLISLFKLYDIKHGQNLYQLQITYLGTVNCHHVCEMSQPSSPGSEEKYLENFKLSQFIGMEFVFAFKCVYEEIKLELCINFRNYISQDSHINQYYSFQL